MTRPQRYRWQSEHEGQLDGKNRLGVPKVLMRELREQDEEEIVITYGPKEGCLEVYPHAIWQELVDEMMAFDDQEQVENLVRGFIGPARPLRLDKQGRFVLPPTFRQELRVGTEAATGSDVIWLGFGTYAELWNAPIYLQHQRTLVQAAHAAKRQVLARMRQKKTASNETN